MNLNYKLKNLIFLNYQFLYQINEKEFILLLGYATLILYLFKYTINIFYSWYLNETKIDYEKAIGLKILENLSRTSNLTFLELPMSRILSDITMRLRIVSQSIIYLINFFTEILIFVILYMSLIAKYQLKAIIVLILITTLISVIYYFYKNIVNKWSFERGKGR